MQPEEARTRIAALGFSDGRRRDALPPLRRRRAARQTRSRLRADPWLETLPDIDPGAQPEGVLATDCFERWEGRGALGYLTLSAIVDSQLAQPPEHARVIAASHCFPTGMLGH